MNCVSLIQRMGGSPCLPMTLIKLIRFITNTHQTDRKPDFDNGKIGAETQ